MKSNNEFDEMTESDYEAMYSIFYCIRCLAMYKEECCCDDADDDDF